MDIIFFDGRCPMCHAWVRRIILWDKKEVFRFAPLESRVAEEVLGPVWPGYLKEDTLVYYRNGKRWARSEAVLRIFRRLGFPYRLAGWAGYMLPKRWRDALYRSVASRRYRYGERYVACPLPPENIKGRFL